MAGQHMYLKRYNNYSYKNAYKDYSSKSTILTEAYKKASMKTRKSIEKFKFLFMDAQNITNTPEVNY